MHFTSTTSSLVIRPESGYSVRLFRGVGEFVQSAAGDTQ